MCSPDDRYEEPPALPQADLDLEDPLGAIPTDLRPMFITEHDHRCPDCGHWISDDEFRAHGRHKSHRVTPMGLQSNYKPKKEPDQPELRLLHFSKVELPKLR